MCIYTGCVKKTRPVRKAVSRCAVDVVIRWRRWLYAITATASTTGAATSSARPAPRLCRFTAVARHSHSQRATIRGQHHRHGRHRHSIAHRKSSAVTGQLADTPSRGLPTRGLDNSRSRRCRQKRKLSMQSRRWHP